METDMRNVAEHVKEYLKKSLSEYTVVNIRRKSLHPDDSFLYMVSAQKSDGTFSVWTSWNEDTQCLNHGHYGLPDMETCNRIMDEYFNSSGPPDEEGLTVLSYLQNLLKEDGPGFNDTYEVILYIKGYIDGITAQQEHKWSRLTGKDIRSLVSEGLKK